MPDETNAPEIETEPIGEVESTGGEPVAEVEAPETPKSYVDLDQFGDHYVPIKVGGEEIEVPLAELQGGYMRQQDYTRKTQEVASQREALKEAEAIAKALEVDPEGTLKVLAEWYGPQDEPEAELENMDPLERQVHEIQNRFEEMDRQAQDAALQAELQEYEDKYGIPQNDLLQFAYENQIPRLDWAYSVWAQANAEAAEQFSQQRTEAEQARTAAKANAPAVEGGVDRSASQSGAPTGDRSSVRSISDAVELAKAQLGIA